MLRTRLISAFTFLAFAAFLVAADVPAPSPAELKDAERIFRDVYGKEFDRVSKARLPVDKVAFAKKLWDSSRSTNDNQALARVLADKASALASQAEPTGLSVVLEITRSRVGKGKDRPSQLAAVAAVLDKMARFEKPDRKVQIGNELVDLYREAADLSQEANKSTDVSLYHGKASLAARTHLPPFQAAATLKDIASDRAEYEAEKRQEAEAERLQANIRANPTDPKANQAMAFHVIRAGRTADAVPYLKASGVERLKQIGALLAEPTIAEQGKFGDLLRAAADEFPTEKATLLGLARQQYEAFLAKNPKGADTDRIRLLAKELQAVSGRVGTLLTLVEDNSSIADLFGKVETGTAKVTWDPAVGYATAGSLKVSTSQIGQISVRHGTIPGWKYLVKDRPGNGEYQYLQFAVKMRGGTYAFINFGSSEAVASYAIGKPGNDSRVYAIADKPPTDWLVVTRDMVADVRGAFFLSNFKIETDGEVWLDSVYLGRSARDLSKFTPKPGPTERKAP